jgi:hypothetical protein
MTLSKVLSGIAKEKARAKPNAKAPLGQGGRFAAGVQKMTSKGMDEGEAAAIMAKEGRSKYGDKKFDAMSAAGRKRRA